MEHAQLSQICGDLVALNRMHQGNLAGHIGIEVTAIGRDFVRASMPVDERTKQPMGLLHGGASVVLAETLGSVASFLLVSGTPGARVAGLEVIAPRPALVFGRWRRGRGTVVDICDFQPAGLTE